MSRSALVGLVIVFCALVAAGVLWPVLSRQEGAGMEHGVARPSSDDVDWKGPEQGGKRADRVSSRLPLLSGSAMEHDSGEGAALEALENDGGPVYERVRELQDLRGREFSEAERARIMEFLSGIGWPEDIAQESIHWMGDELLTALRLQEPRQEDLAARLAEVAFLPGADPVIRDYIIQHLGHLWEQLGVREEIEVAMWAALDTEDETTPGTALIALSRGYAREGNQMSLEKVRARALELAANSAKPLPVRATAFVIASEAGGREVKELAERVLEDTGSPMILRRLAENLRKR
jgi:hypothetical protein